MTPLTAKALSDQEDFYAREKVEIVHSHAANVVHGEQVQEYFSQRGISEGHDIMTGEGVKVDRLGGHGHGHAGTSDSGGYFTSRDTTTTRRDSDMRDNNNNDGGDLMNSLKMFLPRQPPTRGHEQRPLCESSGATPLEWYLTPGAESEPSYIRRQAQYYGDMASVDIRAHQAQVLAEKTVRDGQARKGSTRDGVVYK